MEQHWLGPDTTSLEIPIKAEYVQKQAECGKLFRDVMGLMSFQCNLCPQEFEFIAEFAVHLSDDHPLLPAISGRNYPESEVDPVVTVCMIKSDAVTEAASVVKPTNTPTSTDFVEIKQSGSAKTFETLQIKTSSTVSLGKRSERANFKRCPACRSKFSPPSLEKHIASVGPTIPPSQIKCTEENCEKIFQAKCQLKKHVHRSHKGKVYKCHLCEKSYIAPGALEIHIRVHQGIKPFECNECGRCFSSRACIRGHLNRKHSGKKPYQCWYCGQSFNDSGFLKWHIQVHHSSENGKTFQCDKCEKAFYTISTLKIHYRLHTGERPFACKLCDKTFRHNESLTKHTVAFHINARTFKCSYCPKTFNLRNTVRQHEKQVHEPKRKREKQN